jgi:hypothetical protein
MHNGLPGSRRARSVDRRSGERRHAFRRAGTRSRQKPIRMSAARLNRSVVLNGATRASEFFYSARPVGAIRREAFVGTSTRRRPHYHVEPKEHRLARRSDVGQAGIAQISGFPIGSPASLDNLLAVPRSRIVIAKYDLPANRATRPCSRTRAGNTLSALRGLCTGC